MCKQQAKKIIQYATAYVTDASRIDRPAEWGKGKLTEYYCGCFRKLRSGALPPVNSEENAS